MSRPKRTVAKSLAIFIKAAELVRGGMSYEDASIAVGHKPHWFSKRLQLNPALRKYLDEKL